MFDPLHKWLGIPPEDQPPHHYRLLGLATFEDDLEVIDAAADKQLSFLHQLANGEHAADAEDLSNQVSAARLCLMSLEKKRLYDQRLRLRTEAAASAAIHPQPPTLPQIVSPTQTSNVSTATSNPVAVPVAHASPPIVRRRNGYASRQRGSSLTYWHYSALLGIVSLLLVAIALKRGILTLDPARMAWLGIKVEAPASSAITGDGVVVLKVDKTAPKIVARSESNVPTVSPDSMPPPTTQPPADSSGPATAVAGSTSDSLVELMHPSVALPIDGRPATEESELNKDPLPIDKPLADAMALVNELYKQKYDAAKTSSEKVALADQMRRDGHQTRDDSVGRFALWKVARGIYAKEGRFDSAMETVDELGQHYRDIEAAQWKTESLIDSANSVGASDASEFVGTAIDVMSDLVEVENYALAKKLGDLTELRFGDRMPRSKRAEFANAQRRIVSEGAKHERYLAAIQTLTESPQDPGANQTAGAYLCLVRQQWKTGLKHLAAGPDSPITAIAKTELAVTLSSDPKLVADASIGIADRWYDLAASMPDEASRDATFRHALRWYVATQSVASGLARKKIDMRVEELDAKYPQRLPDDAVATNAATGPAILDQQVRNGSESKRDFASVNGKTLIVGMGGLPSGHGQAEAGVELRDITKLTVTGSSSHAEMVTVDTYSKSGFVVDYHTVDGYVHRVFLGLGLDPAREFFPLPTWGKATIPDLVTDIGRSDSYTIDLNRWAPPDWDQRCWFSLLMHNGGTDRKLEAKLSW